MLLVCTSSNNCLKENPSFCLFFCFSPSCLYLMPVVLCDHPSMPPYTQISGERKTVGSVIRYSCMGQRTIVGNATRVCQLNGQWSGSPPHCTGNSLCLLTNETIFLGFQLLISGDDLNFKRKMISTSGVQKIVCERSSMKQ